MKVVIEKIIDHDQESTKEQIIKEENYEFLEDYFTLEETEERVQENTDVNTDDASNDDKHFEKEPLVYGNVNISDNIKALLKLDPKFATLGKLEMKEVKAEIELLITKIRYNRMNEDDDEDDHSDDDKDDDLNESQEEEFLLAQEVSREIYDPQKKLLDLRKRKCTDLATNPRVFLPKARPPWRPRRTSSSHGAW